MLARKNPRRPSRFTFGRKTLSTSLSLRFLVSLVRFNTRITIRLRTVETMHVMLVCVRRTQSAGCPFYKFNHRAFVVRSLDKVKLLSVTASNRYPIRINQLTYQHKHEICADLGGLLPRQLQLLVYATDVPHWRPGFLGSYLTSPGH